MVRTLQQYISLVYKLVMDLFVVVAPWVYLVPTFIFVLFFVAVASGIGMGIGHLYFALCVLPVFAILKQYAQTSSPQHKFIKILASLCVSILSWLSLQQALLLFPRLSSFAFDQSSLDFRLQQGFLITIVPRASPRTS